LPFPPLAVIPFTTDFALNLATDLLLKQDSGLLGLEVGGEVVGMNDSELH